MNINSIDLNLFLVFQAIYATRSVTLAGDRLGMTQSAVSNALKRMRERFNDALFVRTADGMVPTPVAERLIAPVEEGIACLAQAVDQGRTFEPETSSRTFRIAVNDIGQLVMMPELLSVARGVAPGVPVWRQDHHRPYFSGRFDQGGLSCRTVSDPGSVTARPLWVPCSVQREVMRSPSVVWSSTWMRRSGKTARYSATDLAMPSWP